MTLIDPPSEGLREFNQLIEQREDFIRHAEAEADQALDDEAKDPTDQQNRRRSVRLRWLADLSN